MPIIRYRRWNEGCRWSRARIQEYDYSWLSCKIILFGSAAQLLYPEGQGAEFVMPPENLQDNVYSVRYGADDQVSVKITWSGEDPAVQHSLPEGSNKYSPDWRSFVRDVRMLTVSAASHALATKCIKMDDELVSSVVDPFLFADVNGLLIATLPGVFRGGQNDQVPVNLRRIDGHQSEAELNGVIVVANVTWNSSDVLNIQMPEEPDEWARFQLEGRELWITALESWPARFN